MSYTFAYSVEDGLLTVHLGGTRPGLEVEMVEQHWELFETAAELCRHNGIKNVLFVNEVPGRMNNSAAVALFGRIGDFGLDRDARIAVLVGDAGNRPIVQFGANAAVATGWTVRVFATEEAARDWLIGG